MRNFLNLLVVCVLIIVPLTAQAAEKRVALVIGNSAYPTSRLDNPKNDATAMAATFRRLGFDVDLVIDATKADFDAALKRYAAKADKAEAAVLFYAGHGMQANNHNYLVPIDARPQSERDLKREMIRLDDVIDDMGSARVKLVFFDACRDNPLARSFSRGGARGMAAPAEASGTLISFATKHGNTAADGETRHSPYTEALLAALENPTDEVHALLRKKVTESVKKKTGGLQEPWAYGSLNGDFYLIQGPVNVTVNPTVSESSAVELGYWNGALQANSEEAYLSYLAKYPKGQFADLARASLAKLKKAAEAKPEPPKTAAPDPAQVELAFWDSIKASTDKADFEEYLRLWPSGRFAGIARNRVKSFSAEAERRDQAQRDEADARRRQEAQREEARLTDERRRREETAQQAMSPGKVFRDCPDCPEMVVIPAGRFTMGSPANEIGRMGDEGPQHGVSIAQPLAVGKFEVTRGQFARFVEATGYNPRGCNIYDHDKKAWRLVPEDNSWRNPGFEQKDDHPVACVSWNDAKEYVKWLSGKTGKTYRLLSEAEWEYAARGGTDTARYWGNDAKEACRYANVGDQTVEARYPGWKWVSHDCNDGVANTASVGRYQPNRFGLYDMIGNVWEWTEDCWNENYNGAPGDGSAWTTGSCEKRVLRGGSWNFEPDIARSAKRYGGVTAGRYGITGFRLARMLP